MMRRRYLVEGKGGEKRSERKVHGKRKRKIMRIKIEVKLQNMK